MPAPSIATPPITVAIAGAGFAGTAAAQVLSQAANVEVLLIDRNADMAFIPMLYQVATASLRPGQITYPIRHRFRRWPQVKVIQAAVERVDFEQRRLQARSATAVTLDYDYLILATGSRSTFLQVPGAPEHSFPMRTLAEAVALRDRLLHCLAQAPPPPVSSPGQRATPTPALTFAIVGGGPTGVELAGALAQLLRRRGYRLGQTARIVLVQSGDRLLKRYPPHLAAYAASWLERRGIELRLGHRVNRVTPDELVLGSQSDGTDPQSPEQTVTLATQTVIWTAGLEANRPQSPQELAIAPQGKLTVQPTLQLWGHPQVYGVGDLSHVLQQQEQLTGVAQEALQQGSAAAQNILRQRGGQGPVPFAYNDKGRLAIIGRGAGVGQIGRLGLGGAIGGWLAWLLWLEVHWVYLPGWRNRLSVLGAWLLPGVVAAPLEAHLSPDRPSPDRPSLPPIAHSSCSSFHQTSTMGIQTYLPLVGRTFLSSIFLYAGINNLLNFSTTVERIGGLLPAPSLALAGNILCCLLGSLSLILGFKVRWGTLLLILFLVPTNLIFHPFWVDGGETIAFLKNLSLIGALLFVNAYGPGPMSLDRPSVTPQ